MEEELEMALMGSNKGESIVCTRVIIRASLYVCVNISVNSCGSVHVFGVLDVKQRNYDAYTHHGTFKGHRRGAIFIAKDERLFIPCDKLHACAHRRFVSQETIYFRCMQKVAYARTRAIVTYQIAFRAKR